MVNQVTDASRPLVAQPAIGERHSERFWECNGITLEALAFPGIVRVQTSREDAGLQSAIGEVLGCELPPPGKYLQVGEWRVQWLTPKEWLVITPPGQEQQVCECLVGLPVHVVAISDSRAAVAISGAPVALMLAQGVALDLHDTSFPVGSGTVTRFTKIAAMITRTGTERFEVMVDRAYASYLWAWLKEVIATTVPVAEISENKVYC